MTDFILEVVFSVVTRTAANSEVVCLWQTLKDISFLEFVFSCSILVPIN